VNVGATGNRGRGPRGGVDRDRARCAYRMALDHPAEMRRLAVLDIVPTGDDFRLAGKEFALGFWIWTLLAAPFRCPKNL
jgi:haloacetate dehalogenase